MLNRTRKLILIMMLCFAAQSIAQEEVKKDSVTTEMQERIDKVVSKQKELMKKEVEEINVKLDNGALSLEEASDLKKEIATKYAYEIQRKVTDIKNGTEGIDGSFSISIGGRGVININSDKLIKYDRRTYSDIVVAVGFNNAIQEGKSLNDSDYKAAGSRFFELGFAWRTRVFKESNWLRFKYGLSLQYNSLKPKDNQYFVKNGDVTTLETFPHELRKSKIRFTNLVLPIHFEFGPSKKIEREHYFRYSTRKKFKVGLGGYAGLRIGTRQKLKYSVDGDRERDKQKNDFNMNDFVYGVSGYVSWGAVGLYTKYDLNPLFSNPNAKQNNISLGIRFDMD
ncbi:MAG: hypothetical protein ACPG45_08580 [Flavobacteriaceae bacterium]